MKKKTKRTGTQQQRKSKRWHRKPRGGKTFAQYVGRRSKIQEAEAEIARLENIISVAEARQAHAETQRKESADRERYHRLRLSYCRKGE